MDQASGMEFFLCQRKTHNLYIMRGIPGCGKSHRAERLSKQMNAPIFSADAYFGHGEEYRKNWSPQKVHLGHRDCESKVLARMKQDLGATRSSIIVDNTSLNLAAFRVYLDMAVDNDYSVYFVYPDSTWWMQTVLPFLQAKKDDEESRRKAESISEFLYTKNVHGVPKNTIMDMLMKFHWVNLDEYFDSVQQRVTVLEKELADTKSRAKKLEQSYL
jgi:adenylate kinase family enzyme